MLFPSPEITSLVFPKALIQFSEASGSSWDGSQSKSGGRFSKDPLPHLPPDLPPAAATEAHGRQGPGGLAAASPSQLAPLGHYSRFSHSFCPLRPSPWGCLSRFLAHQLPGAQRTLRREPVLVTPTHTTLRCPAPALSTMVMHLGFVGCLRRGSSAGLCTPRGEALPALALTPSPDLCTEAAGRTAVAG